MSDPEKPMPSWEELSAAEKQSALLANLVMQQTNAALMLLGRVPHPESGQTETDLEGAQYFISQLEMLETKTRGNLVKQEESLLKQSLTMLRLAFVETVNQAETPASAVPPAPAPGAAPQAADQPAGAPAAAPPDEAESRKRFSKKY